LETFENKREPGIRADIITFSMNTIPRHP